MCPQSHPQQRCTKCKFRIEMGLEDCLDIISQDVNRRQSVTSFAPRDLRQQASGNRFEVNMSLALIAPRFPEQYGKQPVDTLVKKLPFSW